LARAHAAGPPAMPEVESRLAEITRACLANNAPDRPPDAAYVAATLRSFASMNPADRDAETTVIPIVSVEPPPQPTVEERVVGWWRRGNRLAVGGASVIVALLLAVALIGPGRPAGSASGTASLERPAP